MSPKNKAVCTRKSELRMIEEVKTRPLFWDTTCQMYKRADLKPLAWEEIASIIGSPLTGKLLRTSLAIFCINCTFSCDSIRLPVAFEVSILHF